MVSLSCAPLGICNLIHHIEPFYIIIIIIITINTANRRNQNLSGACSSQLKSWPFTNQHWLVMFQPKLTIPCANLASSWTAVTAHDTAYYLA
jgi:hypothetical protein